MRNCLDLAYFCCYPPMFKEKENIYKKQTGSNYGCFEAGKKTIFINTLLKEQKCLVIVVVVGRSEEKISNRSDARC